MLYGTYSPWSPPNLRIASPLWYEFVDVVSGRISSYLISTVVTELEALGRRVRPKPQPGGSFRRDPKFFMSRILQQGFCQLLGEQHHLQLRTFYRVVVPFIIITATVVWETMPLLWNQRFGRHLFLEVILLGTYIEEPQQGPLQGLNGCIGSPKTSHSVQCTLNGHDLVRQRQAIHSPAYCSKHQLHRCSVLWPLKQVFKVHAQSIAQKPRHQVICGKKLQLTKISSVHVMPGC